MDDQFSGRTDDDLFYDDFEPVLGDSSVASNPGPHERMRRKKKEQEISSSENRTGHEIPDSPNTDQVSKAAITSNPIPAASKSYKSLSSSHFAPKIPQTPISEPLDKALEAPEQRHDETFAHSLVGPRQKNTKPISKSADPATRVQSGANPRTKLTAEELAAKMEEMKLLNAEKTRKFEEAEKDEKEHAAAFARGMEEARKRRANEIERRKRGEENQKKLESERERNRERKLKAIGMKDGIRDQNKEADLDEQSRKSFRGANGGVRGTRKRGSASSVSMSRDRGHRDIDPFFEDKVIENVRSRGGRGIRGPRGGGRGSDGNPRGHSEAVFSDSGNTSSPSRAEDFPSLPAKSGKEVLDSKPKLAAVPNMFSKALDSVSPSTLDGSGSQGASIPIEGSESLNRFTDISSLPTSSKTEARETSQLPTTSKHTHTPQIPKGSYAASLGSNTTIPQLPSSPSKKWDEEVEEEEEIKRTASTSVAK